MNGTRHGSFPCGFLVILLALAIPKFAVAFGPHDPVDACVKNKQGGPNPSGPALAPAAAQQTCLDSYIRYDIPDAVINQDFDLLYSGYFLNHPYMNGLQPRDFLRGLDHPDSAGKNEFHINQKDIQLNFNYFHAKDSTEYYGSSSFGGPNMLFFPSSSQQPSDRDHIDIYLNHPSDGGTWDFYPAHTDNPDKKEDFPLTGPCSEYYSNAVQSGAVYRGVRKAPDYFHVVNDSDSTWFASGKGENTRINHESQHLFNASRGVAGGIGFPNETMSMAAEYLVGAWPRDTGRGVYNNVYDWSLITPSTSQGGNSHDVGLAYSHWYLWTIYLLQQFSGDTTKVEDDLLYRWVRFKESTVYNNNMYGLSKVLDDSVAYGSLGGPTGKERLRNLFHNYSLAKWVNNPSPSFYGAKYGYSRGVVPSVAPGFFDNSFNPCDRLTAHEVAPKHVVHTALANAETTLTFQRCVTYDGQGSNCSLQRTDCDTLGVYLYSADYIQFEADPNLDASKQNTFHCRITWNAADVPGPSDQSGNSLRISAITYPIRSDSLYLHGSTATGVVDGFVDVDHGFCEVWVPNFGTTTKSVVVVVDLGELNPPSSGQNRRFLTYGYSYGLDVTSAITSTPLSLTVARAWGQTYTALQWSDPGNCGTSGYTIQRSTGTMSNFTTLTTVPAGTYARNDTIAVDTLRFYRVFATGASACSSNVATTGGYITQSQTFGGTLYTSGDLYVTNPAVTLTIAPGTTIRCHANGDSRSAGKDPAKVDVQILGGKLIANGTVTDSIRWTSDAAAPAAGDWRGIYLWGTSGSTCSYNSIAYAVHGIQLEYFSTITVDHCAIRHSQFYGAWAFNYSTLTLTNSVLEQNHGAEFGSTGYSSVDVRSCFLHYSPSLGPGAVDDGAVYTSSSGGKFRRSRVAGVGLGVYCLNSSSPTLIGEGDYADSVKWGRDDILDFRYYGVRTYDEGLPEMGSTSQPTSYLAGRNNLFSRTYPGAIWVDNTSQTQQLSAKHNYWGAVPPDLTRFIGNISGPSQSNFYLTQFESPAGPNQNQYYPGYQTAGSLTGPELLYTTALAKEVADDIDGAVTSYREFVTSYPSDSLANQALGRLLGLQLRRNRAGEEIAFAQTYAGSKVFPKLQHVAKRFLPPFLLSAGKVAEAMTAYETLIADPAFDGPGILFEVAVQKGLVLKDRDGAREAIDRLQKASKDYFLLKHARAMLQETVGSDIWISIAEPSPASASETTLASSSAMQLDQSYPNPMNPRASIAFNLPVASRAALRVYDVQGRLVRTLVDGVLPAGRHVVVWDGRSTDGVQVSSGIYYYRLDALQKSLSRRLLLLK